MMIDLRSDTVTKLSHGMLKVMMEANVADGIFKEDHKKAKEIRLELNNMALIKRVEPIETNVVIFELKTVVH